MCSAMGGQGQVDAEIRCESEEKNIFYCILMMTSITSSLMLMNVHS